MGTTSKKGANYDKETIALKSIGHHGYWRQSECRALGKLRLSAIGFLRGIVDLSLCLSANRENGNLQLKLVPRENANVCPPEAECPFD